VRRALVLLVAFGFAAAAHAAPVAQWSYSTESDFVTAQTVFSAGGGTQQNEANVLSWGRNPNFLEIITGFGPNSWLFPNGGRSALTIGTGTGLLNRFGGGFNDGIINTGVGFGLGNTITHWNRAISNGLAELQSGAVISTLELDSVGDGDGPFSLAPLTFEFQFTETTNNPPGDCAAGSPEPCRDIFVLSEASDFQQSFTYQGIDYLVSLFPILGGVPGALPQLDAEECQQAGAGNVCFGFTTEEGEETTIQFGFSIAQIVPEPSLLGLLGMALFGVAVGRRRAR